MEEANILVPITMFGCIVVFLILFATLQPRRALLASFIGAWLFLPNATYEFDGFPDYDKLFATCAGILLAVFIFDFKRLVAFRPKWVDIPMLIWCLVPLGASVTNFGLTQDGLYDGASEMLAQIILWGVPYLLGRIYFTNWKEIKELAIGMIIGGFLYTPFILVEMRLSPQFHRWIFGYHQHLFEQTFRFGTWRPMVFFQHGLMLAFWVCAIAILSFWLWHSGSIKTVKVPFSEYKFPFAWVAGFFVVLTLMMVSVNAWVALAVGLTTLLLSTQIRTRWLLSALILIVPFYATMQSLQIWPNELTVDFMTGLLGEERAQSLEFRYFNEYYLTEKALEQPVFGWAGWDRQHVSINDYGLRTVADSLWVIFFGKFGTVGLISIMACILTPAIVFIGRYPPWLWRHPTLAPAAALSVILVLYMIDGLLNMMINPLYMIAAGAIHSAYANGLELSRDTDQPTAVPPSPQRPRRASVGA